MSHRESRANRWARRAYDAMLLAYPREFRDAYADEMRQTFQNNLHRFWDGPEMENSMVPAGNPRRIRLSTKALALAVIASAFAGATRARGDGAARDTKYFEIQIIDEATNRGVPLVELVTVDQMRYVTDSAGRIAYFEPGQEGQTVFFTVIASGYRVPKDGFGFEGFRTEIAAGKKTTVALKRVNLAERLYRLTGRGIYRDSVLLGYETPIKEPLGAGMVAGQDSVFSLPYRGKLRWFWGDTLRLSYPLGLFRMSGAVTALPAELKPAEGISYEYFVGPDKFSRAMAELYAKEGVVWLDGFCNIKDDNGAETMLAHYSRRPGLAKAYEQGMMRYNDEREIFERATSLPIDEEWRFLRDHPVALRGGDEGFFACGNPFPVTRVRATVADILNPESYESWTCLPTGADQASASPARDSAGNLEWKWRKGPPITQRIERRWLRSGKIQPDELRFSPIDVQRPTKRVMMHSGTTQWNEHLRRWVMIAVEFAEDRQAPSFLGEAWYSEADSPQGPWRNAIRILTHDKQSFYNPCHHAFLDEAGGRYIYFEGTYCNTFTQSPATPIYNYNQMMYRLDVDCPEIKQAFSR